MANYVCMYVSKYVCTEDYHTALEKFVNFVDSIWSDKIFVVENTSITKSGLIDYHYLRCFGLEIIEEEMPKLK